MSRRTRALMIQIATGDPRPINRQIVDAVRRLIASGELEVGAALPSVRGLAQQLTINPNTVAKAYSELTAEGWLDARAGLGLFVASASRTKNASAAWTTRCSASSATSSASTTPHRRSWTACPASSMPVFPKK
jgi:DNA-binding transcriptional regulator YhcF (GntR family)